MNFEKYLCAFFIVLCCSAAIYLKSTNLRFHFLNKSPEVTFIVMIIVFHDVTMGTKMSKEGGGYFAKRGLLSALNRKKVNCGP